MTAEEYLIGELAKKAGVSVRTIRFYISEGLLPSPQSRGRYTVYDEEYLRRIALIKRLKEAFLPIKEIRTMLESKPEEEIKEFLSIYENVSPSNDALDYISGVLEKDKAYHSQPPGLQNQPSAPKLFSARNAMPAAREPISVNDIPAWKRFEILPGVELHVRDDMFRQYQRIVLDLIEYAKRAFSKKNVKNR